MRYYNIKLNSAIIKEQHTPKSTGNNRKPLAKRNLMFIFIIPVFETGFIVKSLELEPLIYSFPNLVAAESAVMLENCYFPPKR